MLPGHTHQAWLDRGKELLTDPSPAWQERGREILRGEL
jgi:hypothetical protein